MFYLIVEKNQVEASLKEKRQLTVTNASPQKHVPTMQEQEMIGKFHLLEAGGSKKDILTACCSRSDGKGGIWVLEGSQWVKQCDWPEDFTGDGICFCAITDGLIAMGGKERFGKHIRSMCYHYSLSQKRWKKLPDTITPKQNAKAVEIRGVGDTKVLVVGGLDDNGSCSPNCEILDIKAGRWFSKKPLPECCKEVRVAAADCRIFILMIGRFAHDLLEYHPSSDTYTKTQADLPNVPYADFSETFGMVAVAGKLYVVGELNVEYNITTQRLTLIPEPDASYSVTGWVTLSGKNILFCGGDYTVHIGNTIEEYNTKTKQWKILGISLPFRSWKFNTFVASISV